MTNTETIMKLIAIDEDLYNDLLFKCFIDWCMLYSVFTIPLKVLVNNESLYAWYTKQWSMYVEAAFVNDYKGYIQAVDNDATLYMDLFQTYIPTIENYYPRVIMNYIKQSLNETIK